LEQIVAPRDEEVAKEDRGRASERLRIARPVECSVALFEGTMRCGASTAHVRVVDEVIVHECGGLEYLKCCAEIPHRVTLGGFSVSEACHCAPTRVAEAGS